MNLVVNAFLDKIKHPRRTEIDELRAIVLSCRPDIEENIKWNGPNFHVGGEDRISLKVLPNESVHLIFHIGARVKPTPAERLIRDVGGILNWKSNDRAVAAFKSTAIFQQQKHFIQGYVADWFAATL